jgi:hypothetical protein
MTANSGISLQPAEATEATKQLDALADRMERLLRDEAPALTVVAPGRDEVSQRIATTLNTVHDDFADKTTRGTVELREAAATLRAQNDGLIGADQGIAG